VALSSKNGNACAKRGVIVQPKPLTSTDVAAGIFSSFMAVEPWTDSPASDGQSWDSMDLPSRPVSSAQAINKSRAVAVRKAVSKLARLIQIFDEAEQMTAMEISLDERLRVKHERSIAQQKENKARKAAGQMDLGDTKERIAIERREALERWEEIRSKTQTRKNAHARAVRTEHMVRMDYLEREKQFAQNFVNVSRKVAQTCERRLRSQLGRREFAKVREAAEVARQADRQSKERYAQEVKGIEERKRNLARYDQEKLAEQRLEECKRRNSRLEKYREWKRQEKAIMDEVKELRKRPQFIRSNPWPVVELDEIEGAAYVLSEYIGENLGYMEAHLLSELLGMLT
jgi:hypothetical protein